VVIYSTKKNLPLQGKTDNSQLKFLFYTLSVCLWWCS